MNPLFSLGAAQQQMKITLVDLWIRELFTPDGHVRTDSRMAEIVRVEGGMPWVVDTIEDVRVEVIKYVHNDRGSHWDVRAQRAFPITTFSTLFVIEAQNQRTSETVTLFLAMEDIPGAQVKRLLKMEVRMPIEEVVMCQDNFYRPETNEP